MSSDLSSPFFFFFFFFFSRCKSELAHARASSGARHIAIRNLAALGRPLISPAWIFMERILNFRSKSCAIGDR
jgi:hypothetical protein